MRIVRFTLASIVTFALVGTAWVAGSVVYFPLCEIDLDKGRTLFESRCATCHSLDPNAGASYGPNLGRIGSAAASRVSNLSAESYLLESITDPNTYRKEDEHSVMPANICAGLDAQEVMSLVGFLMTHGGSPDLNQLVALADEARIPESKEPYDVDFQVVETGRKIYLGKGKCHECHPLREHPGFDLRAPSLLTAGRHDEEYLRTSIQRPSEKITHGYGVFGVVLTSGRVLSGRLTSRRPESVDLLTTTSEKLELLTIAFDDVECDEDDRPMIRERRESVMPTGLQAALTETEIDSLIAFLNTLQ